MVNVSVAGGCEKEEVVSGDCEAGERLREFSVSLNLCVTLSCDYY